MQNDVKIPNNEVSEKVKNRLSLDELKSATAIRVGVKRLEKVLL